MKILETVTALPTNVNASGKYLPLYLAVEQANGAWVPVECADSAEAKTVFNAVRGVSAYRGGLFETKRRGLVIYIRLARPVSAPITLKAVGE